MFGHDEFLLCNLYSKDTPKTIDIDFSRELYIIVFTDLYLPNSMSWSVMAMLSANLLIYPFFFFM